MTRDDIWVAKYEKSFYDQPTTPETEFLKNAIDNGKAKTDDGEKAPLAMLPWAGLREVALVQKYGHQKYGDFHNFRKGMEVSRNVSCAIRHLSEYMDGQDLDKESGRSHLAHAACRILFLLQNIADRTAIDDRYSAMVERDTAMAHNEKIKDSF